MSIRNTCCVIGKWYFPLRIHDICDHVGLRTHAMFEHTVYMLHDWKWYFSLRIHDMFDHVGLRYDAIQDAQCVRVDSVRPARPAQDVQSVRVHSVRHAQKPHRNRTEPHRNVHGARDSRAGACACSGIAAQNRTEPHRTARNRTEPHRTAQNRTEPHRTQKWLCKNGCLLSDDWYKPLRRPGPRATPHMAPP